MIITKLINGGRFKIMLLIGLVKFPEGSCVLSVGCGLGYIEQKIWKKQQNKIDLHVTDFASDSLRWIKNILLRKIFTLIWNEKFPESKYDIIFSGVDYLLKTIIWLNY